MGRGFADSSLGQSKPNRPGNRNEVLAMSPTRATKFTKVALARPTGNPIKPGPVGDDTSVEVSAAREGAVDTASQPPRPHTPARMGRSWHLGRHSYDDPSNYLG